MPELDPERRAVVEDLRRQIALENELTRRQARAFVRGLQTNWNVPTIQWSQTESQDQFEDSKRLLIAASIFQSLDGVDSQQAKLCYRRSANLLEWLSRADDKIDTLVSLNLLAAAAYQLGGSPAMASALLVQAEHYSPGEKLYARFLRADFDGVIHSISEFWQENLEMTARSSQLQILEEDGEDKVGWLITVELVRVLGLMADTIRRGDSKRFELAKRKLDALEKLTTRTFSDDLSLLVTLLHKVAISYDEASIYPPIRELIKLRPERSKRLERFARDQFSRGRGILWTSQRQGLARLLKEESFALCTPTGSGKTLVANLAIVKELLLKGDDGALALYLVPSRALASEVEAKLTGELGREVIVTGLYGGTDWGVTDYWLDADEPTVLIATVEKADALMRYLGPLLLRRMKLLIIDEAHQVVPDDTERTQDDFAEHSSRSLRLEAFVSRLLSQAPDIVRIALTAVAGGAATPVSRWIQATKDAIPVGSNYRSTRQLIGSFETEPKRAGQMFLEILNGKPLFVSGGGDAVYINLRTPPMPQLPATMRNSINRFNQLDVLWTALHLVPSGRRILISIAQQPEVTMGWYKDALSLPEWDAAPEFELPKNENELNRFNEARAACVDYCGENSYEVRLLDRGIASNHGQMPQRIRRMMVALIDRGICPITVATATLTEGVNLPFDMIFVPSILRRSFNASDSTQVENLMSAAEFRNLAGRAGRPGAGKDIEGITLVPIPARPSTTAPGTLSIQQRQINAMQQNWRTLRESLLLDELENDDIDSPLALLFTGIAQRADELLKINGDEFLDWLESVIPSDISDEAGRASENKLARLADCVDELDGVLLCALEELQRIDDDKLKGASAEEALAAIWSTTFTVYANAQEKWMEAAFIRRGQAILNNIYPTREERSRLYQYGFTPYVGRRFETIAPSMLERLQETSNYGDSDEAARYSIFVELGELIANDRGFGFRVRSTATDQEILANWQGVLGWWMQSRDHNSPDPKELRVWQRFVSDNLDFRLGVALGAVAAEAWSDGVEGALVVPSLVDWKETTGLPWFGFWARELLRWGTLEPFIAFALAEGLVATRSDGMKLKTKFMEWLNDQKEEVAAEDKIDPQLFLEWNRSRKALKTPKRLRSKLNATLDGTEGIRGRYSVIPIISEGSINWIDPAGFSLAQSSSKDSPFQKLQSGDDYYLQVDQPTSVIRRTFKKSL